MITFNGALLLLALSH